jgi:protoporphyrinogen/coproporphyrinogen III oxidase
MTDSSEMTGPRIAVLGAGITGLTAAWQLARDGFTPVVFERSPRVGGAIAGWRQDGWMHELGPNSLLEGSSEVAEFINAVGLGERRLYAAEAAQKRYIVRGGRMVAMPTSPLSFVTTPLFSSRAKLGLMGEPFRRRGAADREETVAEFVERRLGREFLDYAINPFVGGVYAGDPRRLSVRHAFPKLHALEQKHGSLIRGAMKQRNTSGGPKGRIFSFPDGLAELPLALARPLGDNLRLGTMVRTISRRASRWEIEFEAAGAVQQEAFDVVISALPADALASLHVNGVPAADRLGELREIDHPPVASVFTGFRRDEVAHPLDGFGVLVPEVEAGRILGALFSSTLFPGRAPAGHVAITSFVGGARQPDLARLPESELVALVQQELARLIGVRAAPVLVHVQRVERAIPQYALGYQRFHDLFAAIESAAPGLFIGGNARDGISLANCIQSGRRLAKAVTHWRSAAVPNVA